MINVEKNKAIFVKALLHHEDRREQKQAFLDWLETTDFFTAPASTRFHLSEEGGLCQHSLNVFQRLCTEEEVSKEKAVICGLLHDVCKANFYKQEWKNKKVYCEDGDKYDAGGCFKWETVSSYAVDDQFPYGHGEKSVYLIKEFIRLTEDEAVAIRWHMGGFDETSNRYIVSTVFSKYPLAVSLHTADLEASYLDEI